MNVISTNYITFASTHRTSPLLRRTRLLLALLIVTCFAGTACDSKPNRELSRETAESLISEELSTTKLFTGDFFSFLCTSHTSSTEEARRSLLTDSCDACRRAQEFLGVQNILTHFGETQAVMDMRHCFIPEFTPDAAKYVEEAGVVTLLLKVAEPRLIEVVAVTEPTENSGVTNANAIFRYIVERTPFSDLKVRDMPLSAAYGREGRGIKLLGEYEANAQFTLYDDGWRLRSTDIASVNRKE